MQTLYQFGKDATLRLIVDYLGLLDATDSLTNIQVEHFQDPKWCLLLLGGKGVPRDEVPTAATDAYAIYQARQAISHDIQSAVSGPLYTEMRNHAAALAARATSVSQGYTELSADDLRAEPELLPIFMHAAGIFSMSVLRKDVGHVSDTGLSKKASETLAPYLAERFAPDVDPARLVDRLGSTIEGQVRDLLGRYLLEAVVEQAFNRAGVSFQREKEYGSLEGVVYDHRADFVVPNANDPLLFVEVRRSSARHSSLYAKDKMFSAINWKGRHQKLIGVLITDGEWSRHSQLALARVFDDVLPVAHADELAHVASAYVEGDESKLLRLIHFEIEAPGSATLPPRPGAGDGA
jgi:hypothetical protein